MVDYIKRLGLGVLAAVIFFSIVHLFGTYVASSDGIEEEIQAIRKSYKGLIVDYYSGNPHIPRTHIILQTKDNPKFMTDSMIEVAENSEIGDSIIKLKNDNYIIVKKPDGTSNTYIYMRIRDETRNHPDWPEEWRDQWMDATLKHRRVFGIPDPE